MDPHTITQSEFWQSAASFLLENASCHPLVDIPIPSIAFATSGSSSTPKRIVLAKKSLLLSAAAVNQHLRVTQKSAWGLVLPWWHVGGFAVPTRAYAAQCRFHQGPIRWDADACYDWLSAANITHLSVVPTQVFDLVQLGKPCPSPLQAMVVGGGRLETSLGQRARDLGWPVLASYGMTEAGSQIATQDIDELTNPYSPDSLSILPIWQVALNDQGIIKISGDALFHGYLHTTNNGLNYQKRDEISYTTKDRGVIIAGKLSMECRADEIVKILGELVNPQEIERELSESGLPQQRFAVIAIADERKGHRLIFVHENLPLTEITAAITGYHQHAVGYARIEEIAAIDAFPRSDLGKIRRAELIARYQQAMS